MICPYCKKEALWCENKEIYGKNYGKSYMCWLCKECDAYVGCHNNTKKPLGTMANKTTRALRIKAKNYWIENFAPDYKTIGSNKKGKYYYKLSQLLNIPYEETHFAMFSQSVCIKVLQLK